MARYTYQYGRHIHLFIASPQSLQGGGQSETRNLPDRQLLSSGSSFSPTLFKSLGGRPLLLHGDVHCQVQSSMPVAVIPSQFQPEETETPAEREQRTVHDVYESIAPHFSATRYKVSIDPYEPTCYVLVDLFSQCSYCKLFARSHGLSFPAFSPMFHQIQSASIQAPGTESTSQFYAHQVLDR